MPEYLPGHAEQERSRLVRQATVLERMTEDVLRAAGLRPGMRILDVGCGMGDVTMLAARLAGTDGLVVGVDRNPEVLQCAQARSEAGGYRNIRFQQQEIHDIAAEPAFDAVVGRLVLMYQSDPADTVRRAVRPLRADGIVAFIETDMDIGGHAVPAVPLYLQCLGWIRDSFRAARLHTDMGMKLSATFRAAGLPQPFLRFEAGVGAGTEFFGYEFYSEIVRTMLPHMERFGIASAHEVQPDTLAARMRAEAVCAGAQLVTAPVIAAWTRVGPNEPVSALDRHR